MNPAPFRRALIGLFSAIAARTKAENLHIAGIKAEGARAGAALAGYESQIVVQRNIVMRQALQLLKRDGVGPQNGDVAPIVADRALGGVAESRFPIRMDVGDIIPVHQDRKSVV